MNNADVKPDDQQTFGHLARIRVTRWHVGRVLPETVEKEIHTRGPACRVRAAARRAKGFAEILSIEPLTKDQWLRVYGCGAETGRYRIV